MLSGGRWCRRVGGFGIRRGEPGSLPHVPTLAQVRREHSAVIISLLRKTKPLYSLVARPVRCYCWRGGCLVWRGPERFGGDGEALDEAAEFALGGFGLVDGDQGLGFVELGGGNLGVVDVAGDDLVVVLDGEGGLVAWHLFRRDRSRHCRRGCRRGRP